MLYYFSHSISSYSQHLFQKSNTYSNNTKRILLLVQNNKIKIVAKLLSSSSTSYITCRSSSRIENFPKMAPKKSKKSKTKTPIPSASSSSSTFSFEVCNTSLPQTLLGGRYCTNPYQFGGPRNAFEAKTVDEGFYVRVDMPGVGKDTLEVNFENKKLIFSGKANKKYPYESGDKNYHGEITFSLEPLEVSEFKVDINNGVLRMVVVGSGFPPNYNAVSSHSNIKSPQLTTTCEFTINQYAMKIKSWNWLNPPVNFVGMYPFQLDGGKGTSETRGLNDEYCFERIDMPDVDSEGLTLRMRERAVCYGVKGSKYDEDRRLYFGQFRMQCPCACNLVGMDGEITDGVLRVFMKKEKVEETERIGHTNDAEAGPR